MGVSIFAVLSTFLDCSVTVVEWYKAVVRCTFNNIIEQFQQLERLSKVPTNAPRFGGSNHCRKGPFIADSSQLMSQNPHLPNALPIDRSASFFQNYSIRYGVPAADLNFRHDLPFEQLHPEQVGGDCCLCYAFSWDDAFVAFGMQKGCVRIYDTASCHLLWTLCRSHRRPIRDLAFMKNRTSFVCVDEDWRCTVWELQDEPTCLCETNYSADGLDVCIVSSEMPCLSQDGSFLAIPVVQGNEPSSSSASWRISTVSQMKTFVTPSTKQFMKVRVYSTTKADKKSNSSSPAPVLTLSVRMDVGVTLESTKDIVQFSPHASRILVRACESDFSYLVLWPSMSNEDAGFKLQGNRGAFSSDDRYLASWFDPCTSDGHVCFVWDMRHLESLDLRSLGRDWQHPKFRATDPLTLQDQRFMNILACGFVSVSTESSVAICYATEQLQIVVWSLSMLAPVHIIDTSIDAAIDAINFSVSSDQHWICLHSPTTRNATIWSAEQGIEMFHMHSMTPEMPSEDFWADVSFSHTSKYFLHTGLHQAELLSPTPLHSIREPPYVVLNGSESEALERQPIFKFSLNSHFVGLLMAPGHCVDIWNLQNGGHLMLDWKGIVQAHHSRPKGMQTCTSEANFVFHQFALSQNGEFAASCMGDNCVLLWQLKGSVKSQFVARLPSDCFLPRDICFSTNPTGELRLVICQDQGDLIWLDPIQKQILKIIPAEGSRLCRFSADGSRAALMSDLFIVHLWDLVSQAEKHHITHQIPLLSSHSSLPEQNVFLDGRFLAGFDKDAKPIIYEHQWTDEMRMEEVNRIAFGVSDDGKWGLLMEVASCFSETSSPTQSVNGRSRISHCRRRSHASALRNAGFHGRATHTSTLSLVPLTEGGLLKKMHLPDIFSAEGLVVLSPDGRRCAAFDISHRLVVWNAHMTEGDILQERVCLLRAIETKGPSPSHLANLLQTHRSALLNSRDENGMTMVMHSVYYQNYEILKEFLTWALAEECKLAFEGPICIPETKTISKNIIDLSLYIQSPEMTKMLLHYIVDGVTTAMGAARIFEESLMDIAFAYPCLFTELMYHSKIVRPLCTISIPGKWLNDARHLAVTTDNNLLPSAEETNRIWKTPETRRINRYLGTLSGYVTAEASVIAIPNLTKISTGSILHHLNTFRLHHSVYGSDPIRALIDFKYNAYGRQVMQEELYLHFVLLTCVTLMAITLVSSGVEHRTVMTYFFAAVSAVISMGYVLFYVSLLYNVLAKNGLHGLAILKTLHVQCMLFFCFTSYCLIAFVIPVCLIWFPYSPLLGSAIGLSSMALWMRLGQFLETSDYVGPFLVALQEVVEDICWFLVLLLLAVIGSGISLYFLINISPYPVGGQSGKEYDFDAKNPFIAVLMTLMLMLSDIGSVFAHILETEHGIRLYVVMGLLIFYLDLVAVILLNVMIAMMGDSYDRVRNSEKALFTKRKAQVLHSIELGLSQKRKQENKCGIQPVEFPSKLFVFSARMGRYLHIAKLRDAAMAPVTAWQGRLNEIHRSNREENRELQRSFTNQLSDLDSRLKRIEQRLSNCQLR